MHQCSDKRQGLIALFNHREHPLNLELAPSSRVEEPYALLDR